MDWNQVMAALAGAVASAALAIVWNVVDRRRAATEALVAESYAAFEGLYERVSTSRKAVVPRLRGRSWLQQMIAAEVARTKLVIHLGARRWRSKRLGLRATLLAEQTPLWSLAVKHMEDDSAASRKALLDEVNAARATLGRWVAHRRSFWRGDISTEIRESVNGNTEPAVARGPRWWRWLRPGKATDAPQAALSATME